MRREPLTIKISASIAQGTARPVTAAWTITATQDESAEGIGKAIKLALLELGATLTEAVK